MLLILCLRNERDIYKLSIRRAVITVAISVVTSLAMGSSIVAGAATLSADDKTFIMKASQAGMMEVRIGQIAKQKAKSDETRAFAESMMTDHSKANARLRAIAEKKGVEVSTTFDGEHQAMVDRFIAMNKVGFDRVYANQIVADQRRLLAAFEIQSGKGDHDLQKFAKEMIPIIKEHLQMAERLNAL